MADLKQAVLGLLTKKLNHLKYDNPEIEVKAVSSEGANFTTALYTITVSNPGKETLHLFAKAANLIGTFRTNFKAEVIYKNEDRVYMKLATAYNELQDKYGVPEDKRFVFPKYYGCDLNNGKEVFIFENLNAKGYQIIDRFKPIGHQNVFDVTSNLAQFHALGFALEKEYPDLYEEFAEPTPDIVELFCQSVLSPSHIDRCIENMDENHKSKVKKLFESKTHKDFQKFFHPFGRKMLIHGDYRGSNILYKETANGRWSVIPVDYQCVRHGCSATDLLYLVYSGTDEQFRRQHFHQLMDHYYSELSQNLKRLNIESSDVYTRQQFDFEIKEMLPLTVFYVINFLPILLTVSDEIPKLDDAEVQMSDFLLAPDPEARERIEGYIRDVARWGLI